MLAEYETIEARLEAALEDCAAWTETVDALIEIVSDRPVSEIIAASPASEAA